MAFGFEFIITFVLVRSMHIVWLTIYRHLQNGRGCCEASSLDNLKGPLQPCIGTDTRPQLSYVAQVSTVYSVAIGKPHFGNVSTAFFLAWNSACI